MRKTVLRIFLVKWGTLAAKNEEGKDEEEDTEASRSIIVSETS